MSRTFLLLSVCVALVIGMRATSVKASDEEEPRNPERIQYLIDLLASKNPAPKKDQGSISIPKNYNRPAQAVVYLAIQQLLAEGSDAFDLLIEHFDDERYSYSYESPVGEFNTTVGGVCRQIFVRVVQCYDFEIHLITSDQFDMYLFRNRELSLAEWWNANRGRPLWKIQIEAIDQAIAFMETVDRNRASPIHPDAEPLPADEFEKLRKKNLELLKARRASIKAVEQPYRPKSLEHHFASMMLLPW